MNQYAKIIGNDGLVRDLGTQAVLPVDLSIVRKHEARIQELMKETKREEEMASIKKEMCEVKEMLKGLCTGMTVNMKKKISRKAKGNR